MATACLPCSNSIVNLWTTHIVYGRTCNSSIYSVGIHQKILVKFSSDPYKTLASLSALLTVLISSYHNITN